MSLDTKDEDIKSLRKKLTDWSRRDEECLNAIPVLLADKDLHIQDLIGGLNTICELSEEGRELFDETARSLAEVASVSQWNAQWLGERQTHVKMFMEEIEKLNSRREAERDRSYLVGIGIPEPIDIGIPESDREILGPLFLKKIGFFSEVWKRKSEEYHDVERFFSALEAPCEKDMIFLEDPVEDVCEKNRRSSKGNTAAGKTAAASAPSNLPDTLMASQLAALYLQAGAGQSTAGMSEDARKLLQQAQPAEQCREEYILRMKRDGVPEKDAAALFEFECGVLQKYPKAYLLEPDFTRSWFFDLKRRFFRAYPQKMSDIMKEQSLTLGELCKVIDEAEWHCWNSHERQMPDEVRREIFSWRLQGPGGDFAMQYCEKISQSTGISMDSMRTAVNACGAHLDRYKWTTLYGCM